MDLSLSRLSYRPRFPSKLPGIGIIGCGNIVQSSHLPAYRKYDLNVVGAYDLVPETLAKARARFAFPIAFSSVEELLAHPDITVVDIATHPGVRADLIRLALEAGKHVLSQKPLALDMATAHELVALARERNLLFAVNQNGRWSPPWRISTLLIEQGMIGDILAITHLFEVNFSWVTGTPFDAIPHWSIYDYAIHWIDAIRCWMGETPLTEVRAREYRTPVQSQDSIAPWGMWAEFMYANGVNAMIRSIGCTQTPTHQHLFWIHGTQGTIRGSVLGGDFLEIERDGAVSRYQLEGNWFPDGFAGAMGELLCAIAENRQPYHAAEHNLLSLQMTLAACQSSRIDGKTIIVEEIAK